MGALQQPKEPGLHPDRVAAGARIDVVEFAGWVIEVQLRVEPLDLIHSLLCRGSQRHFLFAVEDDLETGRHRVAGYRNGVHIEWPPKYGKGPALQ